jgi:hypothetical protein
MDPGLPGNIHRPLANPGQLDLDQRNIALRYDRQTIFQQVFALRDRNIVAHGATPWVKLLF